MQKYTCYLCAFFMALTFSFSAHVHAQTSEVIFKPVKIDGPVHDPTQNSYWYGPFSETASVLDVDRDGDLDIVAGRNWYEAPLWIKHRDFRPGAERNGPETESNSEFAIDVNKDGWDDIVSSGWMFMKGAYWYENPKNELEEGRQWKSYKIHQAFNMEGVIHGDIDLDGDEDILVNHWSLVEGQGMTWLESIDEAPWFVEHVVGTKGDTHGNGLGDINMDGRPDIITGQGWYEQPEKATDKPWKFHADWDFRSALGSNASATAHPNLVYDVNEDGLNDAIIGSAHAYGLAWYEQKLDEDGNRSFERHWIETDHSVFHTLALGDLNGDGKDDLIAGKRLFAHYGGDVGVGDPSFVFWYDMNGGDFKRHILFYNHAPFYPDEGGINPPPNNVVGVGMKINVKDMNKDGRTDVILAGKTGLYVFYNEGSPPTPKYSVDLAPYYTYPTWRQWPQYVSLFNGKDFSGWNVPEGDNGHWQVKDYLIDYDALSEAEEKHLWTEPSFKDFDLHIDFRFKEASGMHNMPFILPDGTYKKDEAGDIIRTPTPNSDSGILLRGSMHQVNLWNWNVGSGELWSVRTNEDMPPELRAAAVPKKKMDRPLGDWNSMDIRVIGDRVSVMLNGEWVIENAQIPGLPEEGPIGLQHHGGWDKENDRYNPTSSNIQFRNIWVRPIDSPIVSEDPAENPEGWETLFNGEDLSGWITGPNNKFVVDNGELTVKRDDPDGQEHNLDYLWTEEAYGDFILDLDFKVIEGTNSGVFFRTSDIMDPVWTGLEIQVANSHGRRDLSKTGTAGAVYDLLEPTKNAINPPGEWNTYRLMCVGSRIQVWLNGEHVIDMDIAKWREAHMNPDGTKNKFPTPGAAFARSGHIGLQDHGQPVWYRNIKIKRLDPGWETLFNGEDLSGWITGPNNKFVVENGELTVKRDDPDGQEHNLDYLWTEEAYGDFVLDLDFKVIEGTNSGVFFRTSDITDPVWTGLEIQVANSHGRNELSKTGTAGAVYDLLAPTKNAINAPGEWNTYRLKCVGSRIQVWLNGEHVVDMDISEWNEAHRNPDGTENKFPTAGADFARSGHIGLQDHGQPVWYRNIKVKRLD